MSSSKLLTFNKPMSFLWIFKWAQETNVINASKVARSHGKKMKVSSWFNISDILSCIPETTNFSPVGGFSRHPKGFTAFGIMPNTWLPQTKATSSFDNR